LQKQYHLYEIEKQVAGKKDSISNGSRAEQALDDSIQTTTAK